MSGRILFYTLFAITAVSFVLFANIVAYTPVVAEQKHDVLQIRTVEGVSATAWGVFDPSTGKLIDGVKTTDVLPIASVAKLFTAYAVAHSKNESEETTITWSDLNTEGESGKLVYGATSTLGNLLFPLLLESSNDAAAAIERTLEGSFEKSVLALTEEHVIEHTVISDPAGLSSDTTSTVLDLARFYAYLNDAYPHIVDITLLDMYVTPETGLINNNPAQKIEGFIGGKQGFTSEAGKTFVGAFAVDDYEVGVVLLGSSNLPKDIESILNAVYVEEVSSER